MWEFDKGGVIITPPFLFCGNLSSSGLPEKSLFELLLSVLIVVVFGLLSIIGPTEARRSQRRALFVQQPVRPIALN